MGLDYPIRNLLMADGRFDSILGGNPRGSSLYSLRFLGEDVGRTVEQYSLGIRLDIWGEQLHPRAI